MKIVEVLQFSNAIMTQPLFIRCILIISVFTYLFGITTNQCTLKKVNEFTRHSPNDIVWLSFILVQQNFQNVSVQSKKWK